MDFTDSTATGPPPPSTAAQPQEEHHVASVTEDLETTCWGCGSHLTVAPYAPIFRCGWCGAITNHNAYKVDNKYFWWRCLRDRCFFFLLSMFMLFMIGGGIWAIYPVAFSVSYFFGVFHVCMAIILSLTTIITYCLAAFRTAGAPPIIPWGSYPVVGRGGLHNYTFCLYCTKPKSPRTHHCRSCGMCVLDMDHHCPFIGNCVGAANHRSFILFLTSAVTSTIYVSIMSSYAATYIWPPLRFKSLNILSNLAVNDLVFGTAKEIALAFLRSALFLSPRGLVLVYLFIASVSVEIGLAVLLWQQLCFIYEGKTYLSSLSSQTVEDGISDGVGGKDIRNLLRFFGCPSSASRFLPSFWSSRKSHDK